jgi:hypothetical protein
MTEKRELQLFLPLIMGVAFFLAGSAIARGVNNLNRYTRKGFFAAAVLVAFALYLLMWSREIAEAWRSSPAIVFLVGAGFVSGTAWLIVKYRGKIKEWNQIPTASEAASRSGSRKTDDHDGGNKIF